MIFAGARMAGARMAGARMIFAGARMIFAGARMAGARMILAGARMAEARTTRCVCTRMKSCFWCYLIMPYINNSIAHSSLCR